MTNLQKMPEIPSANSMAMAGWGRNGDTLMAHVTPGETVVPKQILDNHPELRQTIAKYMEAYEVDPTSFVVGSGTGSYNPVTGQQEFFLKKIKKIVKKIASSPIGKIAIPIAASFIPGLGPGVGAAIASAATTKISGGSWGQALGAGAGSYLGGQFLGGGINGTVGGTVGAVSSGLAQALPASIANASLSSVAGAMLGTQLGTSIGGMIDAPDPVKDSAKWGNEYANMAAAPASPTAPSLAIPGDNQSANSAPTASAATGNMGAGVNPNTPGVSYLTQVKDRNTGQMRTQNVNDAFGGNFNTDRRNSWGSGVAFA